jgi:hypothetical protein
MSTNSQEEYGSFGGSGGIFGSGAADDEMHDAMMRGIEHRDDGTYVDHARNLRARRARKEAREEMFVVQRAIDEIPELVAWMKQSARNKIALSVARAVGMENDYANDVYVMNGEGDTITGGMIAADVARRMKDGLRDSATDFVAKILYRAYMRDQIERDRAFNTLRGADTEADTEDAAATFASRIATRLVGKIMHAAGMAEPSTVVADDSSPESDQTP